MRRLRSIILRTTMLAILPVSLAGCGINAIPTKEEAAKAKFADVQTQYQRRGDLIPNLVNTVQANAQQERTVLVEVTQARARATQTTVDPSKLTDPQAIQRYQAAQDQLSGALGRLMVIVEKYPELKSNENFLALQSQLEGTENRIAIARQDYITAVKNYNTEIRTIPGRWWRALLYPDAEPMQNFSVAEGTEQVPEVKF